MVTLEERLFVGMALIEEFGRLADNYDPHGDKDEVNEIIRRANLVVVKMVAFSERYENPAEMKQQISEMVNIINKLKLIHDKL